VNHFEVSERLIALTTKFLANFGVPESGQAVEAVPVISK
jgi:hypothetical protein